MRRGWLLILCAGILLAAGNSRAATNAAAYLSRLEAVPPSPALVVAAQANGIPLDQIDPAVAGDQLDPGDSISGLITLFEKGRRKQWLVYLEVVSPGVEESARKPRPPMVLYSSFGGTQACVSAPAFVVVRTLGPFLDSHRRGKPPNAPEKRARFELNKGFLSLGLHHAAAAFEALEHGPVRGSWSVSHKPFSPAEVAKGKERAERLGITTERDRALIGSIPALLSYFDVIRNSPGLSDIFFEVVDLPSAWSLLRNLGIRSVGLRFDKGAGQTKSILWALPESAPAYHFPMVLKLNDHRALNLRFVVTSPHPPLLACGGVVGLLAEHPGDKGKYLTFRIIGARRSSLRKT